MALYDLTGSTPTHILMYDNLGSSPTGHIPEHLAATIKRDEAGKVARELLIYLDGAEIDELINDALLRLRIGNYRAP